MASGRVEGEDGTWPRAGLPHGALARVFAVALWGGGLMQVSGCAGTEFKPDLAFAIPAKFETTTTVKAPDVSRWWTRFRSTELNQLIEVANVDNLDIAAAVAQLRQAEAQAQITGAVLWPTLGYSENSQRSRLSGGNTAVERNSFSKVLNASYILDVWGQNRDTLEAALHTVGASAYQIEVVRLATRASVVNSFFIYGANRERVTIATENLRNAERILDVIRQRQTVGTASELDIAQQQSLVEIQRAAIPALRQAAETARTALAILIGKPVQAVNLTTHSVRSLRLPVVTPGLPATLLLRRPDIRSAEESLASADADVSAARKAFLPNIQLTGQTGFQSALLSALVRPGAFVYTLAAGVTQPIFDGGRLRGQLALTEAQRQQLLENYRKSIVSALTDVENALIATRENAAREHAQRLAVAAARRALNLSEERLRQGTIDLTTLLNTQSTLFQAEDTLIQIRLARLQAAAGVFEALGGDWEEPLAAPPLP